MRRQKHNWKITILHPITKKIIEYEIVERLEESKFISDSFTVTHLRNYFASKTKRDKNIKIEKIKIQ